MSNPSSEHSVGFVSRVRVIEEQPLESRAAGYAGLHDELAKRLDAPVTRTASESAG
ncbi:hypothetical protein [Microbacterium sp. NC79]|uniref:hypothetical protein n=1 Tax=Microbacterium sp. NC79 TaxID=2851009 RepID=UPI001C2CA97C|nr:hypothetical protein [Microbacterium sp. NC79]MBV0895634.1 hypothetical protein [Microbacterium sp. NC79]